MISGHSRYDRTYEIKIDRGKLYYLRYDVYDTFGREDEPCAIDDLKMAASLGDAWAIYELRWLGLSLFK